VDERLQWNDSDYKREKITKFPLCLKLGSSYDDGEWFLFSVNWLNDKLLFGMLSKSNKKEALLLTH